MGARKKLKEGKLELPASFEELDNKQQKFLVAKMDGKTDTLAALEAGYSESTARIAGQRIMDHPDVRQAARDLVQAAFPPEMIIRKLQEGLDATIARVVTRKGKPTKIEAPDFGTRLNYLKFIREMAGYKTEPDTKDLGPSHIILDL